MSNSRLETYLNEVLVSLGGDAIPVAKEQAMATEHFPCLFKLGTAEYYVIWSVGLDGLVRDDGRVLTFQSLEELHVHAIQHEQKLTQDEIAVYDWDAIERWCNEPTADGIAPGPFLNAWNMVLDVLAAHERSPSLFSRADGQYGDLYTKLFRANNLPAMTIPGAEYYAAWTTAEVDALGQLLRLGLAEIRDQLERGKGI